MLTLWLAGGIVWTSGVIAEIARAQDPPGATQPFVLHTRLEPPNNCANCHANFRDAPIDAWEGTMMANAMRDPLFLAGLSIANQDIPGIGEFCLRCHTPPGWLEGRCLPGDTSALVTSDFEGVTCDVCHRMVQAPEGPLIGNAMYTMLDGYEKTGSYNSEFSLHPIRLDPFLEAGELCGVCHEVSNPLFGDFPIERTFSEWASSAFPAEGETCQSCHFPRSLGAASNHTAVPEREINVHRMVGGNAFIPLVLKGEYPELGRDAAFDQVIADAEALLQDAAVVTIDPVAVERGTQASFAVRVENTTGHKLPSGYPEGRRAWLEVTAKDATGRTLLTSGVYDEATQTLDRSEPQIRIYEARLGSNGVFSYHMVEQDEILFDGRIPPRGFRSRPDLAPVGREFEVQPDGTLAHWDTAPYTFDVPADVTGPISVTARLLYQSTTREYVEFLRDANTTDDAGQKMYDLWVAYGMDPPMQMELALASFEVVEPPPAVWLDTGDDDDDDKGGMCGCESGRGGGALVLAPVLALAARTRRRTA